MSTNKTSPILNREDPLANPTPNFSSSRFNSVVNHETPSRTARVETSIANCLYCPNNCFQTHHRRGLNYLPFHFALPEDKHLVGDLLRPANHQCRLYNLLKNARFNPNEKNKMSPILLVQESCSATSSQTQTINDPSGEKRNSRALLSPVYPGSPLCTPSRWMVLIRRG